MNSGVTHYDRQPRPPSKRKQPTTGWILPRPAKQNTDVGIGTLADILVVLGLIDRLADLIDIRKDDLGLALIAERQPRRGFCGRQNAKGKTAEDEPDAMDPDGASF